MQCLLLALIGMDPAAIFISMQSATSLCCCMLADKGKKFNWNIARM